MYAESKHRNKKVVDEAFESEASRHSRRGENSRNSRKSSADPAQGMPVEKAVINPVIRLRKTL
jgi:hypothetical protein